MQSFDKESIQLPYPKNGYVVDNMSELLKVLYSSLLQPEKWKIFLELLCELSECQDGFMLCIDSQFSLSIHTQGAGALGDPQRVDAHRERYCTHDPFRQAVVQSRRTGVFDGEEILSTERLLGSQWYREHLAPRGLRSATLIVTHASVHRLEVLSLWRTDEQGPLDKQSRMLLEMLFPHVQRALEIRQALQVERKRADAAEAIADANPTAMFLAKSDRQVVGENAAAGCLLEKTDSLRIQNGYLVPASETSKTGLRDAMIQVRESTSIGGSGGCSRAVAIGRTSSGQPVLNLIVNPLSPADRAKTGADVLVFVQNPKTSVSYSDIVLGELYGFTRAQAEVANGLLAGYNLQEISRLRGVSIGTVRQQVKAILAKTATDRQSDMVRLLLTVPQVFN